MRSVEWDIKTAEPYDAIDKWVSEDACIRVDTEVVFAMNFVENLARDVREDVGAYTDLRYPEARQLDHEDS
jgi:hypothetical protein